MSAGGRRSYLQTLRLTDPEHGEQRFRYLADLIDKGKLSLESAAKTLDMSTKTLSRNLQYLKNEDAGRITAAPVGSWELMPESKTWEDWLALQIKGFKSANRRTYFVNKIRHFWETTWGKKPLSALTEQDFQRARKEIEESKLNKFGPNLALRYLIRGGYGDQVWLTKFLRTKGLKGEPRMAPELMIKERFLKVAPTVLSALYSMGQQNVPVRTVHKTLVFCTPEIVRTTALEFNLKRTSGIRTGSRENETELWGTRIGEGKTRILLDSEGRFQLWEVFAKKSERWTIRRDTIPPGIVNELEEYIRERGLKQGDFLLPDRFPHTARAVLKEACVRGGLVPLSLHDLRKYYGTALAFSGIPLEVAIDLNVGWKDIKTLKEHYLMIKGINAEAEAPKLAKFLELEENPFEPKKERNLQVS